MNKVQLTQYLEQMDRHLRRKTVLTVYGSAAFILLDEVGRTSLDIDVAGPYSQADMVDIKRAAGKAGLRVNPDDPVVRENLQNLRTDIHLWGRRRT